MPGSVSPSLGTIPDEGVRIPAQVDATSRWRRFALALAVIELGLLYAPTAAWLWDRWTMSVWHNAHGAFIPPIAAYFVHRELRGFVGPPSTANPWGFALLLPALALHALDAGMHTQLLSAASILIALPGLSLLLLGTERTRAIIFPLAFLAFALPIPLAVTEQLHWQLRQFVTAVTGAVVPLLDIPVFVEGTTLHLANARLEVADACSGFSTLYAAIAVAFIVAYMTEDGRQRLIVLLAAAPLAIAANLLRVIMLTVLVAYAGQWVLDTMIHPLSGMMTFALALPVIFWLGGDPRRESQPRKG